MMSSQKSPLSNGTLYGSSHKQGKHNDEASYMSLHSHRRSSGLSNQQLLKQLHNGTSDLPSKIQQVNADTRSQRQRPLNGRLKPVENQTQKDNKSNQFENTFPVNRQGTSILTTPSSWEKRLPVNGQGTLIITKNTQTPFLLSVENEKGHYRIILKIEKDQVSFIKCIGDKDEVLSSVKKKGSGIEDGKISYWFSYDRDNLVLKYGKGYLMEETTILVHDFLQGNKQQEGMKIRENLHPYFNAEDKKFVRKYELLDFVKYGGGLGVNEELVEFEKDPFNTNISPLVMDSSKVNLFYLDEGNYIFSASLPVACRELYENIKGCCLNYSQEVTGVLLSDAIRYSLETKGCILNTRLEEKASGFGKRDIKGTYLRITLGQRLGKSP
ncbi:unnamed protein product [Mytilus edulis]|uniref:Uncharacterized protein n=1 Tax=Mytilus edulis TaxID=6550 RepID=A0A8S3VNA7_MYTED|nr:unnamed protein product [Mytilus edulis]